jgi:AcrR family transcriptional regulator
MPAEPGRSNQRLRTRRDLLEAGVRLSAEGRQPSLDEIAGAARVSRATAYRYFASAEALLAEASAHVAFPDPDSLLHRTSGATARLIKLDQAAAAMISDNEPALRAMLASAVRQATSARQFPVRQNRRSPAIAAALAPHRQEFSPRDFDRLEKALALVIGTEAFLVFRDVLDLSDGEAAKVRRWTIEALVEKAKA